MAANHRNISNGGGAPTRVPATLNTGESGGRFFYGGRQMAIASRRLPQAPAAPVQSRVQPVTGFTAARSTARLYAAPTTQAGGFLERTYTPDVVRKFPRNMDKSKGLRHFSSRVCDKVKEKVQTNYNEVADELVAEYLENNTLASSSEKTLYDSKNIRRRVYDALNVLMAMNIIEKEKKEIRWVGLPTSSVAEKRRLEEERSKRRERIRQKKAQTEYAMTFDRPFEIHDDIEVLKRLGLSLGLQSGSVPDEKVDEIKEMLPAALRAYVDTLVEPPEAQVAPLPERPSSALEDPTEYSENANAPALPAPVAPSQQRYVARQFREQPYVPQTLHTRPVGPAKPLAVQRGYIQRPISNVSRYVQPSQSASFQSANAAVPSARQVYVVQGGSATRSSYVYRNAPAPPPQGYGYARQPKYADEHDYDYQEGEEDFRE